MDPGAIPSCGAGREAGTSAFISASATPDAWPKDARRAPGELVQIDYVVRQHPPKTQRAEPGHKLARIPVHRYSLGE